MGEIIKRETREFKRNIKRLFQLAAVIIFAFLLYTFYFTHPSHNKDWEQGFEIMPNVKIDGTKITINNLRDYEYLSPTDGEIKYKNTTVDLNDLEKVWFISEPFSIKPFTHFGGVAHTYFVFDFKNHQPIAVSVEARREKGETYDAWKGLVNSYELFYVWGTESDETIRRVVDQQNKLYMYPLTISPEHGKELFLQLAQTTIDLEKIPRFYNTFTSNCTNELAKNANKVKENAFPETNRALYFPGYADEELYKLGYIPNDKSLDEISKKYDITEFTKKNYLDKEYSKILRAFLNSKF